MPLPAFKVLLGLAEVLARRDVVGVQFDGAPENITGFGQSPRS
jgi:hypothetical protein